MYKIEINPGPDRVIIETYYTPAAKNYQDFFLFYIIILKNIYLFDYELRFKFNTIKKISTQKMI